MTEIQRKFLTGAVVADAALGERQIRVVANSGQPDRVKDVLKAAGCKLDNYRRNPIVLADHDPSQPIGNFAPEIKDALEGIITFAPAGISAKADEYCGLYKSGVMNTVSVGFKPIEYEDNKAGGVDFLKWELLELSCVAVPCDPNAVVTARSLDGAKPQVWKVGASLNLPLREDAEWRGSTEARAAIFDHADFDGEAPDLAFARKGFLLYRSDAPRSRLSYPVPFADMIDGRLTVTPGSLRSAREALESSPDCPPEIAAKARAVLDHYEAKMQHGKALEWAAIKAAFAAKADPATVALVKSLFEAMKAGRVLSQENMAHVQGISKCLESMADCQAKALDSHGFTHDQLVAFAGHLNTAGEHAKALLHAKPKPKPKPDEEPDEGAGDEDPDDDPEADVELAAQAERRKRAIAIAERQ